MVTLYEDVELTYDDLYIGDTPNKNIYKDFMRSIDKLSKYLYTLSKPKKDIYSVVEGYLIPLDTQDTYVRVIEDNNTIKGYVLYMGGYCYRYVNGDNNIVVNHHDIDYVRR